MELMSTDSYKTKVGEILLLTDGEYDDYRIVEAYKALKEFDIMETEHVFRETIDLNNYLELDPMKYECFLDYRNEDKSGYTFNNKDYTDDFIRYLLLNKYMERTKHQEFSFNFYQGFREFIKDKEENRGWEKLL